MNQDRYQQPAHVKQCIREFTDDLLQWFEPALEREAAVDFLLTTGKLGLCKEIQGYVTRGILTREEVVDVVLSAYDQHVARKEQQGCMIDAPRQM